MELNVEILSTMLRDVFFAFYKILFFFSTAVACFSSVVRLVHIDKESVSIAYRKSKKVFFWCICLGTGFAAISAFTGFVKGSGIYPMSTFLISFGVNFHWMSKSINVISQITEEYCDD